MYIYHLSICLCIYHLLSIIYLYSPSHLSVIYHLPVYHLCMYAYMYLSIYYLSSIISGGRLYFSPQFQVAAHHCKEVQVSGT